MRKPEIEAVISEALSKSEITDPGEVFNLLMAASKHSDAALGAAVRRQFSVIGLCLLVLSWEVDSRMNRPKKGRPRAGPLGDLDCQRAFMAWRTVALTGNRQMSNLQAIEVCRIREGTLKTPNKKCLFRPEGQASLEQSLSRGRTKVGMADGPDDRWQSAPFDEWQAGYTAPDC